MNNDLQIIMIGKFGLAIPLDEMYDVATLKKDMRPAIRALERVINGKRHPGRPKKEQL